MMEVTKLCQRGATDFVSYYNNLCALQSTCPVASIRGCAEEGVLNCHINKLKRIDWHPILTALRVNRILHTVVFYDKWEERAQQVLNDGKLRVRLPIKSKNSSTDSEIASEIIRSVRPFLLNSQAVRSLILEGIQLQIRDIKSLTKGLEKNGSLKHLSLKGSNIGDKSLWVLSQVLKSSCSLEWFDLTYCQLTANGMNSIAAMIRYQSLHRQNSVWKDSLRGQHPVHSTLSGLRRVTLNLNPDIRDSGAAKLAEALEDDVWIKALDMQTCGLTSNSAHLFQKLLQNNSGLMVLDLRENPLMDDDELDTITEQLTIKMATRGSIKETYRWLDVETLRIQHELTTAGRPIHRRKETQKSVSSSTPAKPKIAVNWTKKRKGMPWRTAARSSQRWRNLIPQYYSTTSESIEKVTSSNGETLDKEKASISSSGSSSFDESDLSNEPPYNVSSTTPIQVTLTLEQFKALQDEIVSCHEKLKQEQDKNTQLKERMDKLEAENVLLRQQLDEEKAKKKSTRSSNLDEQTIQNIETTFKQFNAFLDLLNEKGYGHLTSLLECT